MEGGELDLDIHIIVLEQGKCKASIHELWPKFRLGTKISASKRPQIYMPSTHKEEK